MNRIKELMNQIKNLDTKNIISIIAGIIIIAVGVWMLVSRSEQDESQIVNQNEEGVTIVQVESTELTREDIVNGQYRNDVRSATTYVQNTQEVQVAVVIEEKDSENNESCGQITFIKTRVVGPAVLTNSLNALFNNTISTDFNPGNIIPKYHSNLSFERAVINQGVAQIYLAGTFSGSNNAWCDSDLAIAQIVETAKGFSTVNSVEVFQNGVKVY